MSHASQVLCTANRNQQLALHELLCSWHKQLAASTAATAAAAAGATGCAADGSRVQETAAAAAGAGAAAGSNARLAAFLLLVKHLSGFYALEQTLFRQRVITAMKANTATAAGGAGQITKPSTVEGAASQHTGHSQQQQQQQQHFDYMLGEEEAACVDASTAHFTANLLAETAPACYLPLLLQLVGVHAAPTHVRVSALAPRFNNHGSASGAQLDNASNTHTHMLSRLGQLSEPIGPHLVVWSPAICTQVHCHAASFGKQFPCFNTLTCALLTPVAFPLPSLHRS
jgi:hypothetical protein